MNSVIPLASDTYYLPLRQDFIAICEECQKDSNASPYCMALILAVMEKWTNEKIRKEDKNLSVTMTYPQWVEEIYGTFKRNTVIASVKVLVSNGLLKQEGFRPAGGGKDQYKYSLEEKVIKERLEAKFEKGLRQSLKSNDQSTKSNSAKFEKGLRDEENLSLTKFKKGRYKERHTSHYIESKKEGTYAADATTNNPSSSLLSEKENEIVRWFCEIVGTFDVTLTPSAITSTQKVSSCIETKDQLQSLYEIVKVKTAEKKDPTVYLANLKDGLLTWKQQQASKPAPAPDTASQDEDRLVLWSRHVNDSHFACDKTAWYLFEEMPLSLALQYEHDDWGGLPSNVRQDIRFMLQQEKEGKIARPTLVVAI